MSSQTWIIIPVKRLTEAKSSLQEALGQEQCQDLVLCMLEDVISAAKGMEAAENVVVSSGKKILGIASSKGARTILEEDLGLNQALKMVIDKSMEEGVENVIIIPADVPMVQPEDLKEILSLASGNQSVVITPSEENGTNALLLRPPDVIDLHFGGESFPEHVEEARSRGITPEIYRSERLERDIDNPSDLLKVETLGIGTRTHDFLKKIEQS